MLLTETYKNRLKELAGIKTRNHIAILKEVEDWFSNSDKRVKFDMNIMKQAIQGGFEVGLMFQSDNEKYKMPTWKMRVIQPVAMGYDKKGQLMVRGVHLKGQSEKKAIQTGQRSAEAKDEWRLFKVSNIKSMFLTGRVFTSIKLSGYNPNDSAMTRIIANFNPQKAIEYQKSFKDIQKGISNPETDVNSAEKSAVVNQPTNAITKPIKSQNTNKKNSQGEKELKSKIDRLNKLI